jgi:hypothetical protein
MPEHTSSWTIGAGSVIVLFSLCLLAASVTDRSDQGLLAIAASSFSIGILTIACGIYLKARALGPRKPDLDETPAKSKTGGCERCEAEAPVIHCRVHHLHLCGTCLAEHYDFRSCAYVPSTRKPTTGKPTKGMAAKAR